MNLTLDNAAEIQPKAGTKRDLGACVRAFAGASCAVRGAGRIMLKGDNITLMQEA